MKRLGLILILSLAANVLLAGWWLVIRPSADRGDASIAESPRETAPARAKLPRKSPKLAPTQQFSSANEGGGVQKWKDLQSADLKEFIGRLRAVGCPEETIQDIILAEVNRQYLSRSREIWPDRYKATPFWETTRPDPTDYKKNRERTRKDQELQKEKSAELVELLGIDPEKERRKEDGLNDPYSWMSSRISFLPESKREAVQKYLEEFEDKRQEFYARNRGLYDAQYRSEQKQLEAEQFRGLAQFLTPQELREYELRQSQMASQLSFDLRGMTISREQYEAIFDIRKKYGDSIYNYGDIETKEGRQAVEDSKKSLQAELVAALGPEKGKEYERSQDYSYQQLVRLVGRTDLPPETAVKVYDFKDAAEQTAKQIRVDPNLSAAQRQAALLQIRTETEKTVKETLGEKNFTRYLREGGYWLNSIAPAPPLQPRKVP
jgi:hypothetical protein